MAKRRKQRNEDKMLARDSDLRGNLACRADRGSVESGSPSVHVGAHRFGALKGAFGTTSRGRPRNDIPARPFFGLRTAPKSRNRRGTASTKPRGNDAPPPDRRRPSLGRVTLDPVALCILAFIFLALD